MRKLIIATTLGLALIEPASAAQAATGEHSCSAPLNALLDEWDAIAFLTPAKPAQLRVPGRYGYESTGGQVTYMQNQIRLAVQDCRAGREEVAIRRIDIIQNLLRQPGGDVRPGHPSFWRQG